MARQTKLCNRCKEEKPVDEFTKHKTGLYYVCRSCAAINTKEYRARLTSEQRAVQARRWGLKRMYGITEDDYQTLYEVQNGECAICHRTVNGRLHIDHDHATNEIRGLLCNDCNRGIGLLGDDYSRLIDAAMYVMKTKDMMEEYAKVLI